MIDTAQPALRLLWAEDNKADQYLIRTALDDLHSPAQVTFVKEGEAVLAHLAHEAEDLVVLDVDMPGMGGIETLRRIRGDETDLHQPIAMFSSHPEDELAGADREACTAYVQEPVEFAAFVAAVGKVLQTSIAQHHDGHRTERKATL